MDINVACRLSEIANSMYFNLKILCSKHICICSAKYLCFKYFLAINLSDVHLMVVMLFMSCINAVNAVQFSLQVFRNQNRCLKGYGHVFPKSF